MHFCLFKVRLSSGPGDSVPHGAVNVFYNKTWQRVCDAGFDDVTARAVCQELGYRDGKAVCCSAYGSVELSESLNPNLTLKCRGDEASFKECILEEPCESEFYASVICIRNMTSENDTGMLKQNSYLSLIFREILIFFLNY